jgi:CDP-diglyceride synthetase
MPQNRPIAFASGIVGSIGVLLVVALACAAIAIPIFAVLWATSILLPGQLEASNLLALAAASVPISLLTFLGEGILAWLLRRHPVQTIAADAIRRIWVFIFSWLVAGAVLLYWPGLTLRGPAPALIVATLSAVADVVTEYVSEMRKRNHRS